MVTNQVIKLFTDFPRAYLDFWAVFDFNLNHGISNDSDSSILIQQQAGQPY
jgi:hypothetical protein